MSSFRIARGLLRLPLLATRRIEKAHYINPNHSSAYKSLPPAFSSRYFSSDKSPNTKSDNQETPSPTETSETLSTSEKSPGTDDTTDHKMAQGAVARAAGASLAQTVKLHTSNLGQISKLANFKATKLPSYDRKNTKEGIVHLGVGGFHRAHLAAYIHKLLTQNKACEWSIAGVGLQPFDHGMRDALKGQDSLFTLIERSAAGSNAEVIGSITSYLFAPDNPAAVIEKMANPDTRIVSMTITESGYFYNENTHQLLIEHPDIVADLQSELTAPKTTFGYLYASLAKRYEAGLKPFTVLSCDNMQKNGSITGHMLQTFASHRDPKIAKWISEHGAFPNSMVDRITPRTTPQDIASLKEEFGVDDAWPVVTEPFLQWVLEDKFALGRPDFEEVGVQVVPDVHQVEEFECHKLRLLNASHTAMAYLAFLSGFTYVHQVIEHPLFSKFIRQMMHEEVKPLLPAIKGVDLDAYCDKLIERFSNPTIMDQINRLTLNGSGKLPQFIMPTIAEQIMAKSHNLKRLSLVVASWFRYLEGVDEHGNEYKIDDARAEELHPLAQQGGASPYPLIDVKNLFGDDLRNDKIFMGELAKALESLKKKGALETLAEYVD